MAVVGLVEAVVAKQQGKHGCGCMGQQHARAVLSVLSTQGYIRKTRLPQNLQLISLLSMTGKKVILKIAQRHICENGLLRAGQFGFREGHSTTL
jgi:hypothetical protein